MPRPPSEAIADRRRRPVGFGTIAPAAAAFQHVHNAADNAAIVLPLETAHVGWQVRFDPLNKFLLTILILHQRESVSYCHSRKINEFSPLI